VTRARTVSHCTSIIAILLFVWLYYTLPGRYYGLIDGSFTTKPPPDSDLHGSCYIHFESKTQPTWKWDLPHNFTYDQISLNTNGNTEATVNFPSFRCRYGPQQKPFSKPLLKDLLISGPDAKSQAVTDEQIDFIFGFIVSAADGTLPPPRHHHYHFDSPCHGDFAHFCLGQPLYPGLAVILLAAGIILWSRNPKMSNNLGLAVAPKPTRSLLSLTVIAALANYALSLLAVSLNGLFAASLCRATLIIAALLIPVSVLYSIVQRFATRARQWDCLGVYLSILCYQIIMLIADFPRQ